MTRVRCGEERASRTYPFGSFAQAGARLFLGTDWPAASNYSTFRPLEAIEVATTRRELNKPTQTPLPAANEQLDLHQAIHGNTLGAAYQLGLEKELGSIHTGKLADLVMLERNLFEIPAHEIHQTKILMTMMNGIARHGTLA